MPHPIIDFHTHAFPDKVAAKAIPELERRGGVKAYHQGTVDALLGSMDRAGIAASVVCSIATRPEQYQPILDWSLTVRSERIVPLPSVHPQDPLRLERLREIHDLGFPGIKMHPYYQDFYLDDRSLDDFYATLEELGLLLVMHTGYDIGFPQDDRAAPRRILQVLVRFSDLLLVTTHLGAWNMWDEVRQTLTGKPVYMEVSFSLDFLDQIRLREMILAHPRGYVLFGTDSPWSDQKTTLERLASLGLDDQLFQEIVSDNGHALLARAGKQKPRPGD